MYTFETTMQILSDIDFGVRRLNRKRNIIIDSRPHQRQCIFKNKKEIVNVFSTPCCRSVAHQSEKIGTTRELHCHPLKKKILYSFKSTVHHMHTLSRSTTKGKRKVRQLFVHIQTLFNIQPSASHPYTSNNNIPNRFRFANYRYSSRENPQCRSKLNNHSCLSNSCSSIKKTFSS